MRNCNKLASLSVLAFATFVVNTAYAYGPEGLFGGRAEPDSSIVLGSSIETQGARPDRAQSVLEHPRPDYDPVPVALGSFELFPSLELGETYDSNIYATKNNKNADAITSVRPIVSAFSNWGQHAVSVTTFGDINKYADKNKENFENFLFDANGRYDLAAQTWLSARAGFQKLSEPRSSPDNAGGTEPTTFYVTHGGLSAYRGTGLLHAGLDYDVRHFEYDEVPTSTTPLSESARNRNESVVHSRVSYDLTENFKPYVSGDYNWRTYNSNSQRQSQGYDAVVGATADFGGITSLDAYVGWLQQNYNNFGAKNLNSAVKYGGKFEWNVTGLTSLVLEANRTVEETTDNNFNSYLATGGSATLTHELRRNILVEADSSFTRDEYNGTGSRTDDIFSVGAGTRWLINRSLYGDLVYDWSKRTSDLDSTEYAKHQVTMRLGARL